jgi:uncharacterized membrane protein
MPASFMKGIRPHHSTRDDQMHRFNLRRIQLPVATLALAAFGAPNLSAQSQYTVDPIEAPANGFALYPSAINNAGLVVGWWYGSPITNRQPFIYSHTTGYTLLPKPAGNEFSVPMDINDDGAIVGFACPTWSDTTNPRGWKLENGVFSLFPPQTHAVAINESHLIVGSTCIDVIDGSVDCVFISNAPPQMQTFAAVGAHSGTMDRGIVVNDLGQTAYRTAATTAVFRDADGTTIALPPAPAGWTGIEVDGINNDGLVIAHWTRSTINPLRYYSRGFVWSAAAGTQEFGVTAGSTRPRAINNLGQVVFESGTHDFAYFDCWLWSSQTGPLNLDNKTDYGDNLVLTDLYAINDAGQIVAGGDTISPPLDIYVVLNPIVPGMPGDANGDGQVNVDDLIAVVIGWGPCPAPPTPCPADVNNSGAVDVDDLIMVILNWG